MSIDLRQVTAFSVQQRLTAMANRYDVSVVDTDGSSGQRVAFAQQKRLAMREQVTIYTDDSKGKVLCAFRARQVMDVRAAYDVTAADGSLIGGFRKDFARSFLRSAFHLEQPGMPPALGQERDVLVAVLRRFVDLPLAVHFDFATADGSPVMSSERRWGIRDAYQVTVHAPWLDRRLAIAMAIGLDALLAR